MLETRLLELRDHAEVSRVAELADGIVRVDGNRSVVVVQAPPSEDRRTSRGYYGSSRDIDCLTSEFTDVDGLLLAVEGAVVYISGSATAPSVSYLPAYTGSTGGQCLRDATIEVLTGTAKLDSLDSSILSSGETVDLEELLRSIWSAGHLTYHTPPEVATLATNWALSGDRTSFIDIACGAGELLTAGVEQTETPGEAWGIDASSLARALTVSRGRDLEIPDNHVICTDFFAAIEGYERSEQLTLTLESTQSPPVDEWPQHGFDAVLGHVPAGTAGDRRDGSGEERRRTYRRVDHSFVHAACELLSDGGRGCFVLPSLTLRDLREDVLPDGVALTKVVRLPDVVFSAVGIEPVLVCVERTTEEPPLGVLKLRSFDALQRICGAVHAPETADRLDHVNAATVDPDLDTTALFAILDAPAAAPFFSGRFETLDSFTSDIKTGMVTVPNGWFYFTTDERAESGISDRFFTPVIKSPPEGTDEITLEDIDTYLFDLRAFVDERDLSPDDPEGVATALEEVDQHAAEYVHDTPPESVLPRSIPLEKTPDIVVRSITSPVTWYRVQIEESVLYNNSVVGLRCREDVDADSIHTLLNTPFYQRLLATQLPNLDAEYVRVQIGPLRQLPVPEQLLMDSLRQQLESFEPYETTHVEELARTALLEALDSGDRDVLAGAYDAVSPLSTLEGFEDEIANLQAVFETPEAESAVDDLINQELLARLEATFETAELFTFRRHLITELLAVYEEARYWSFMGGIAAQFEGILQDFVENTGGDVEYREDDEGNERLEYQYRDDWKPLRLKVLLDEFFSGELLEVMQQVRKQRNEIAHGRLLKRPREIADAILLAFFVFTFAMLREYNKYLAAPQADR